MWWCIFWNSSIIEIKIPNSVTYIGDFVFEMCQNLKKVSMADSVTYLGMYAFDFCTGIQPVGKAKTLSLNSHANCEWKSSNSKIATVNQDGKVTAKKKGKVTIKAILYGKEYEITVTVK